MKPRAYYNEIDGPCVAWTKELIKRGLIMDGEVDSRSIVDVRPEDLKGFTQCHFFSGLAAWSYALRLAKWSDERPIWTGSAPCQPWSTAGKNKGFKDERHLWPEFYRLIESCKPPVVVGEQVCSKDALSWLDVVFDDLENATYEASAIIAAACGVGAPHKRRRLYFVADTFSQRCEGGGVQLQSGQSRIEDTQTARRAAPSMLGNSDSNRSGRDSGSISSEKGEGQGKRRKSRRGSHCTEPSGSADVLANTNRAGLEERQGQSSNNGPELQAARRAGSPSGMADSDVSDQGSEWLQRSGEFRQSSEDGGIREEQSVPGPVNGVWRDADWLYCTDRKWRCTKPNLHVLVNGATHRVGRIRAYGNAIVAPQAAEVIKSYMDLERY